MDSQVILRRLVEMAGGPAERGYVLALVGDGLRDLPAELSTSTAKYAVVHPTSEIGLRHVLWKADGAPVLALLDEPLARRLPADFVRRARGRRVYAVEPGEVLSLALQVPVVGSDDDDVQRLAIDNVDRLQAALRERTLPTVVDRELLDELLLDVLLGKQVRKCTSGELLAGWLRDPPTWPAPVSDSVRRQLPKMHGLEGRILACGTKQPRGLENLLIYGVLLAVGETEVPQSAWGPLLNGPGALGLTPETFRTAIAGLARQTLDVLGPDANPFLERAETVATKVLTPSVLAGSRDLPLGLDNLCHELVNEMGKGGTVAHATIQEMQRHRFAAARAGEIAVLEQMARLSRYLAAPQVAEAASVTERVRAYQRHGAFADWAAARLQTALAKSASFRKDAGAMLKRYRERRNAENLGFAKTLQADYVKALHSDGCVPLHRIWRHAPVLDGDKPSRLFLVVLDGCSYPVFLRLLAELAGELSPLGLRVDAKTQQAQGVPALSIVPTITSHARSAIFLGEVPKDPWIAETTWRDARESTTDPARFKQNSSLGARTRKLFLKGDLADHGDGLLGALRDPALDVVAVVFNAVDDQIGSSNTGAVVSVRAEEISGFIPSLREAIRSKRRVIVTADHGHTPFWGKELRVDEDEGISARYRVLKGSEVVPEGFIEIDDGGLGGAPGRKAYAWKMGVYQGKPQVGFHGGCSLEEMVVPLAELVEGGVAADEPSWWYGGAHAQIATPAPPKAAPLPAAAPVASKRVQGDLFDASPLARVAIERIGLPTALLAQLDESEQAALACVYTNQNARISDIAKALRRPGARVPGLMSRLVGKLHAGGFPCLRRQPLPDGEDQYVYLRQGTERA